MKLQNKSVNIFRLIEKMILKRRPIIAGPESPTQQLSCFIDKMLKPKMFQDDVDCLTDIPTHTLEHKMF